jgi:hypothetical protein
MLALDLNDTANPHYNNDLKLLDPQDIVTICHTLVTGTCEEPSMKYAPKFRDYKKSDSLFVSMLEHLQLIHSSLRDYLLSSCIQTSPTAEDAISEQSSHIAVTQILLVYLLREPFSKGYNYWNALEIERARDYPLYDYAARYLGFHLCHAGPLDKLTWSLIRQLFASRKSVDGGAYRAWVAMLWPGGNWGSGRQWRPLYVASSCGMTAMVKDILCSEPGVDINALGGRNYSSPLQVACYRNRIDVVRVLLNKGAITSLVDNKGHSCLFLAMLRRNVDIIELLEKRGARINDTDREILKAINLRT